MAVGGFSVVEHAKMELAKAWMERKEMLFLNALGDLRSPEENDRFAYLSEKMQGRWGSEENDQDYYY